MRLLYELEGSAAYDSGTRCRTDMSFGHVLAIDAILELHIWCRCFIHRRAMHHANVHFREINSSRIELPGLSAVVRRLVLPGGVR